MGKAGDKTIHLHAATRGVTGTYDLRLPNPSGSSEPWGRAEAEGRRGWLAERYKSSPPVLVRPGVRRSPATQPHELNDPLLLDPQTLRTSNPSLGAGLRHWCSAPVHHDARNQGADDSTVVTEYLYTSPVSQRFASGRIQRGDIIAILAPFILRPVLTQEPRRICVGS